MRDEEQQGAGRVTGHVGDPVVVGGVGDPVHEGVEHQPDVVGMRVAERMVTRLGPAGLLVDTDEQRELGHPEPGVARGVDQPPDHRRDAVGPRDVVLTDQVHPALGVEAGERGAEGGGEA